MPGRFESSSSHFLRTASVTATMFAPDSRNTPIITVGLPSTSRCHHRSPVSYLMVAMSFNLRLEAGDWRLVPVLRHDATADLSGMFSTSAKVSYLAKERT